VVVQLAGGHAERLAVEPGGDRLTERRARHG
jgi:hypothetical protein